MSGAIEDTPGLIASPAADSDGLVALDRARDYLRSLQEPGGWWKGDLETNVTMDAEDMLLREFLGIREAGKTARCAAWIRSQQREDGTWSNFAGGPGDLSTTIESYVALRLAGDDPAQPPRRRAAEWVRANGGLERARVFTHIWMALFGAWDWNRVPAVLPEMILLPPWFPLNVYDFACWARPTVVALSVVLALRPVRPLPFSISELDGPEPFSQPPGETLLAKGIIARHAVLQQSQRFPLDRVRQLSLKRIERWIVDRQEDDGGWGGIQPPWGYSLIALNLLGYELDHPVMERGLAGLETFTIEENGVRRLEACQSPVWDTCLSLIALTDAGVPADDPAIVRAADWMLDEQILARGA